MNRIRSIAGAAALALGLVAGATAAHAQTFSTHGGTPTAIAGLPGGFDPQWFGAAGTYAGLFDLDTLWTGAALMIDAPATLSFTLVGVEAAFNNAFVFDGQRLDNQAVARGHGSNTRPGGALRLGDSFSAVLAQAGALDFGFLSNGVGQRLGSDTRYTGVLVSADRRDALILFNDRNGADRDFDDMVIRVSIAPVPEPETALMWLAGLAGLGGWLRRRAVHRARG